MPEYITDKKGRKHKLLHKKVDFYSFMGLKVFEDLVDNYLRYAVSDDTYSKLFDLIEVIYQEINVPNFEEYIGVDAGLYGYNMGDCENE